MGGGISLVAIMVCSVKKEMEEDWEYLTKILVTNGIGGETIVCKHLEEEGFWIYAFIKQIYI